MPNKTPDEMLADITRMFPYFDRYWRTNNGHLDENGWSDTPYHALFAEFSHYFRDNIKALDDAKIQQFCDYIEQFVRDARDTATDEDIDNATCTCFLENIGGDAMENKLRCYLGPKSLRFHTNWHGE